ncbi:MAG: hypothetical protein IH602_09985 [Bryobacteraceae bacterium]|nr:hypothetical protein [Bryobacteraceae bacterium]
MRREEIDRLLARLSSGEITPEERAALYDAALEDQALFEELFAEEALAEALSDEQLRDEFLIREAGRQSVEAELETATGSMAAASPRVVRMPETVAAGKRRIPWWGWAVPAAVAASTVIGVILLREPARESQVAQTKPSEVVQVAQAQPEKAAPEPAAPAPSPARQIADKADAKTFASPPAEKRGIAESPLKKSEPVLMARRDEAKIAEIADKAAAPQAVEPSRPAAAAAAAPPPAVLGSSQAGGRAAESEARAAPAQVAEFRTAAPPQAEGRVARDAQVRNEAAVQARAKTVAAERDDALALRSSAALQSLDANGNWQDVQPGGRVARRAKLRVKLTAHEAGAWTLLGSGGRTVELAASESTYIDLPAYSPGLNRVELTFRPGSPAVMRMRSVTEAGRLGRISIPFTIE